MRTELDPATQQTVCACAVCGKTFPPGTKRPVVRRHITTHYKSQPIKCYLCDVIFTRHDHMRRHCKTVHLTSNEDFNALKAAANENLSGTGLEDDDVYFIE